MPKLQQNRNVPRIQFFDIHTVGHKQLENFDKEVQTNTTINQIILFFSDDQTVDQIVFRDGTIKMVNLGGVDKPTGNWVGKDEDGNVIGGGTDPDPGTGTGTYGDFKYSYTGSSATITGYTGSGGSVNIPSTIDGKTVTAIAWAAFSNKNITSVTLPDSITYIGHSAFSGNQLTEVSIPDSVISIANAAFVGNQLTSVTIPDSVTFIGNNAFTSNNINSITIGANVTLGEVSFEWAFDEDYEKSEKAAGTYILVNTDWVLQE